MREVLRKIGYNPWKFTVFVFVHKQSQDIDAGVTTALEARNGSEERYSSLGAGDQGTVYGYATNETREMLPLPLVLAHRIVKRVDAVRKDKIVKGILPDGKAQVTVEYEDGRPKRVMSATLGCNNDQTVFVPTAYGICSDKSNSMLSDNPHSGIYQAETSRTIDANGGNPGCNQGGIAVVALQGSMIGRENKNGPQGSGVDEDVSFTLNTIDRHAVAYAMTTAN